MAGTLSDHIKKRVEECFSKFTSDTSHNIKLAASTMQELVSDTENKLRRVIDERLKYEKLIYEITRETLKRQPLIELINYVLRRLGETVEVSRVYFFEYDRVKDTASNKAEWVATGIQSFQDVEQEIPTRSFPYWRSQLLAGKVVQVEDSDRAPDEATAQNMIAQNTKSVLSLPIFVFNHPYAFLGFDECREKRKWKEEDVDLLRAVCRILAQTIEKERWEEEIISVERMAAMGRLAGAVAHEINNPLQGMLLHLDLLKPMVEMDRKAVKSFHHLEDGVRRISEIVSRILQIYSEQERGEKFDINDVVRGALILIERSLEHAGCEVELDLADDIPKAKGMHQLVHQAILNILNNAMESMGRGGKLRIASYREKGWVYLDVQDDGQGISADDLPHIFEPFFSSKGGSKPGLGLFITHTIVTGQGGRISVQSREGKGTKVQLSLPEV